MKTYTIALPLLMAVMFAPSLSAQGAAPAYRSHLYIGGMISVDRDSGVSGTLDGMSLDSYESGSGGLQVSSLLGYQFNELLSIESRIALWAGADSGNQSTGNEVSVGAGAATALGARLGYSVSRWAYPYVFAGFERVWASDLDITTNETTTDTSGLEYESGPVWAVGVDFMIIGNWSLRVEYFEIQNEATEISQDRPELSLGATYRFRF